jgi:hypothetical protein
MSMSMILECIWSLGAAGGVQLPMRGHTPELSK